MALTHLIETVTPDRLFFDGRCMILNDSRSIAVDPLANPEYNYQEIELIAPTPFSFTSMRALNCNVQFAGIKTLKWLNSAANVGID